MKKLLITIMACIAAYASFTGCKKDKSTPSSSNADFVKALAASCTNPFVAQGDSSVYALPTAFTPNGDGLNDIYFLEGLYPFFNTYLMTIYKTNGTKVFETTEPGYYWDGRDTDNVKCTDYKYYVKIKYTTPDKSVDTGTYLFMLQQDTVHNCINRVAADTLLYRFPSQFNAATGAFSYPSVETFCN